MINKLWSSLCEQDNVKWFSHIKIKNLTDTLFNYLILSHAYTYLENGSMNSLGFYQKENFVEVAKEGAKRNGLELKFLILMIHLDFLIHINLKIMK